MKHTVVTSCSAEGWQRYGQRFVHTFLKHWPAEVELVVTSEDLALADIVEKHVYEWPRPFVHFDLKTSAGGFIQRFGADPVARGRKKLPGQRGWSGAKEASGYNFRYDAARFGLKAFAVELAARYAQDGRLYWVDADVVTFAPVNVQLLKQVLPEAFALSCLDRGDTYHSECGFVGYNLEHPQTHDFVRAFRALYASGRVLGLAEWHDSWVFDWLRREHRVPTHAIPHTSRKHPFVNSVLGRCMDHLKGARKDMGRTPPEEVNQRHDHAYWRLKASA